MKCEKCGNLLDANNNCPVCNVNNNIVMNNAISNTVENQEIVNNVEENVPINNEINTPVKPKEKNGLFITLLIILLCGIATFGVLLYKHFNKNIDKGTINLIQTFEKNERLKFKIKDMEFYIGDPISSFLEKGFTIDKSNINNDIIEPDSIVIKTFYYDKKPLFLGELYCASSKQCNYQEAKLIKANFFKDSKVIINDKIDFSSNKDNIEKEYGPASGVMIQDNDVYVWSSGNNIGDYYYEIRFDSGGLFSLGNLEILRIGIWWLEDEAQYTIQPLEVTNNEKE